MYATNSFQYTCSGARPTPQLRESRGPRAEHRRTRDPREPEPLPVTTWLTPRERSQVDAAGIDQLRFLHRQNLAAVGLDLAKGTADAALISAASVAPGDAPVLAALRAGFPAHLIAALVCEATEDAALTAAVLFGTAGFRAVVDTRNPDGWSRLRETFDPGRLPDGFMRDALATVVRDIAGTRAAVPTPRVGACDPFGAGRSIGCVPFLRAVFAPGFRTTKGVADRLGIHASTLISRFYRAGLPSPRHFLIGARLVWAAHLAEWPGLTIADIADRMDASSPQSFGRMVRTATGLTAGEFRARFDGARMLDRFRATLVAPYRDVLLGFDPLAQPVGFTHRVHRTRHDVRHSAGRAA